MTSACGVWMCEALFIITMFCCSNATEYVSDWYSVTVFNRFKARCYLLTSYDEAKYTDAIG